MNYHEWKRGIEYEHSLLKQAHRQLIITVTAVGGVLLVIVATVAMILEVLR